MSPSRAVTLTVHTLTILGIHIAHLAYIKAILIAPRGHPQWGLVPRPAAAMLAHPQRWVTRCIISRIQTDAALTSLPGPPTQTMLRLGWGEEYAHQSDASHSPVTERILAEAGAYYTRELVFSLSTAMKSRPAYYTQVHIIQEILSVYKIC